MKIHGFVIRNFRNLGLCEGDKSQEAFLRLSRIEGGHGGLTILIGESNSGKSNLLKALEKFGHSYLFLNDSQTFEDMHLLSQDDIPESPSKLTSIALAYQEPAYYLHYRKDIAPKSGTVNKEQAEEDFDMGKHLAKLQDDFDSCKVYVYPKGKKEASDSIKLLLKNASGGGRFMRCAIEPLKNFSDYSIDELNVTESDELNCPFVVGYKALNVKQNFADYINGTSQHVESSIAKEYGHIICLENDGKPHRKYYSAHMNDEGDENTLLYRHFQESPNKKHKQLRVPHIVLYAETHFCDNDLSTTPDKIKESKLFKSGITKKLMQINQDFSMLYGEEGYRFELNIDIDTFALEIYRGEQLLSLEKQGSGFRKLFDFVFSLTQRIDGLQRGDIVLIDDVEEALSVPMQKRLRTYLRDIAQKRGILFIASTHSPFMIDCNHLDEIRLLKARENGHGTEIVELVNADGTIKENELDYVAEIVGVNYRSVLKPASKNGIEA